MSSSPEDRDPSPQVDVDTERMALQSRHRAPGSGRRRGWLLAGGAAAVVAVAGLAVAIAPAAGERPAAADPMPTEVSAEPRPTLPAPTWQTSPPSAPPAAGSAVPVPDDPAPSSPVAPPAAATVPPQAPAAQPSPGGDDPAEACTGRGTGHGPGGRGNRGDDRDDDRDGGDARDRCR